MALDTLLLLREPHPLGDRYGPRKADQPAHAGASREPTGKHHGNPPSFAEEPLPGSSLGQRVVGVGKTALW